MTSFLPPSPASHTLASTPPQHPVETLETSLELAEVLESDRYPSILTRLGSGSESTPQSEQQPETSKSNMSGIAEGPDRTRHTTATSHQVAMASKHHPEHQSRSPPTGSELEEDDVSDIGQGGHNDDTQQQQDTPGSSKSPAYVAPISKIGHIPPISQPGIQSAPDRPALPPFVGELLLGKPIDEDGDIVDEKTGQVLAHAAGDLPSMIGRSVSNAQGDILGDDGELLGYVADIEWPRARPPPNSAPRSLFDLMGRTTSSLMVDHAGNILDANGAIVGTFHDNNNPLHRKEKEEKEAREREHQPKEVSKEPAGEGQQQQQKQQQQQSPSPPPPTPPQPQPQQQQQAQEQSQSQSTRAGEDSQPRPGRTDEERRQNAEDWRKENPNESPSDIFLDVKSTREGIQLIIRIPTVFNGQQTTPHISFS